MRAKFGWAVLLIAFPCVANGPEAAKRIELGREVFTRIAQPSCALCHVLADAGAAGTIGPSLDEIKPDAKRVEIAVREGVGVMPPFAGQLTPEQIEAVSAYVARAAGSPPSRR